MRVWTAHARSGTTPMIVCDGFSWGALVFGPLWLTIHRVWIPAALVLVSGTVLLLVIPGATSTILMIALAIWLGRSGQDLRRRSMRLRGFTLIEVIVASDETEAFARLLELRPNVASSFLPPRMG